MYLIKLIMGKKYPYIKEKNTNSFSPLLFLVHAANTNKWSPVYLVQNLAAIVFNLRTWYYTTTYYNPGVTMIKAGDLLPNFTAVDIFNSSRCSSISNTKVLPYLKVRIIMRWNKNNKKEKLEQNNK